MFVLAGAASVAAHEIPPDVTVRLHVVVEPARLVVLVRAPLAAMRDVQLPLRADGSLELVGIEPRLREAAELWLAGGLTFRRDGRLLGSPRVVAVRLSLPSDPSFAAIDTALAHLRAPPPPRAVALRPEQALLDALLEVPLPAAGQGGGTSGLTAPDAGRLTLQPRLAHLGVRTTTLLHVRLPDGGERLLRWQGDRRQVRLDPRWPETAAAFVGMGIGHILSGYDHLLFLLCLVIPVRRLRPLLLIVTSFTVAHSVTLIASAFGLAPDTLWFAPLIELLIAASILVMALENILGADLRHRWAIAFAFGLVHGFGFSFALRDGLQFAGRHVLAALLSFNLGVELGQLAVLAVAVPVLAWLFRRLPERTAVVVASALIGHEAWHWMTERGGRLLQYRFEWPAWSAATLAAAMRWAMLALIAAAALWALSRLARALQEPAAGSSPCPVPSSEPRRQA